MAGVIVIQAEGIWTLAEEIPHTVHAGTSLHRRIDQMASDESFISLETPDPVIRELCDLWEIPYHEGGWSTMSGEWQPIQK